MSALIGWFYDQGWQKHSMVKRVTLMAVFHYNNENISKDRPLKAVRRLILCFIVLKEIMLGVELYWGIGLIQAQFALHDIGPTFYRTGLKPVRGS